MHTPRTPSSQPARDDAADASSLTETWPGSDASSDDPSSESFLRDVAAAPITLPPLAPGTVIDGSFEIVRKLGAGGMGVVYLAHDLRLHRQVAIKLHNTSAEVGDEVMREAKVMARVSHPNVITVYEVGSFAGQMFIAMEYIEGGTLRGWLEERQRGVRELLDIYLAAARGLAAAHDVGLVHRDFKPDNVLVGARGQVCVADFGLARQTGLVSVGQGAIVAGAVTTTIGGTPAYMSPEQTRGDILSARSDQYSFCFALRESLGEARIPGALRRVLARGLEHDPARRWESMPALIARLERIRRRPRVIAASAAALLLACGGLVAGSGLKQAPEPDLRCTGAAAELVGAWSDTRAEALHAALVAGGLPAVVADSVRRELDRWGASWVSAHQEACRATRVRGEQSEAMLDARMACLSRGRGRLAATVDLLVKDPLAVPRAQDAAAALPDAGLCLESPALLPPPADVARAKAIEGIDAEVARARVLVATGRFADADAPARHAVDEARRAGYAPATAAALYVLGSLRTEQDAPEEGVTLLAEAVGEALAGGDEPQALEALATLGYTLADRGHRAEADRWFALAMALLERSGRATMLEATLVAGQVDLRLRQARFDEAAALAARQLELCVAFGGPRGGFAGSAYLNVAVVHQHRGRYADALATYTMARDILATTKGPEHPSTLNALSGMSASMIALGEYAEAERVIRGVIDGEARLYGPDAPRRGLAWDLLATARLHLGDTEGALAAREEHVRVSLLDVNLPDRQRATMLGNLAITYAGIGRLDEAKSEAERSLAAFERAYPAGSGALVAPHQVLGTLERYLGHLAASRRLLSRAMEIAEAALPEDDPDRLNTTVELALTELAQGQAEAAVTRLEPAVARLERSGYNPMNLAEARFTLARALRSARREPARAVEVARLARAGYVALGEGYEAQIEEIDAWLATK